MAEPDNYDEIGLDGYRTHKDLTKTLEKERIEKSVATKLGPSNDRLQARKDWRTDMFGIGNITKKSK